MGAFSDIEERADAAGYARATADIVAWLRGDEKGRGLVGYRDAWNVAAMVERCDFRKVEAMHEQDIRQPRGIVVMD